MNTDFSLTAYEAYLRALKTHVGNFLRFQDFIPLKEKPERYCLIRHDVDRKPANALNMAILEHSMGIISTYYFRAKPQTFKPEIIKKIAELGHEIGYHYESLSDQNGNMDLAIKDFEENLLNFRKIVPIHTVSMHGRPLKPYDNRDIWRNPENHKLLKEKFKILGEVYLDINYSDIAYINDTGRNWTSGKSNRRDKVDSTIDADFKSGVDLLNYLNSNPHPKICFQIHPERWSNELMEWTSQLLKDQAINTVKFILSKIK